MSIHEGYEDLYSWYRSDAEPDPGVPPMTTEPTPHDPIPAEPGHRPLSDGYCPACYAEAAGSTSPYDQRRHQLLGEHLYEVHGIKPHPYRRDQDQYNLAMCEAVHRHIHASADPNEEQGQEWFDHDVTDLLDDEDDPESEPTTEAGRRLFTDLEPMDLWESSGVTPADIAAIEAEARASLAAENAELRKALAFAVAYVRSAERFTADEDANMARLLASPSTSADKDRT